MPEPGGEQEPTYPQLVQQLVEQILKWQEWAKIPLPPDIVKTIEALRDLGKQQKGEEVSENTHDFVVYSYGLVSASVCSSLGPEETARRLNEQYPTGLDHPWMLAEEPFRTGEPNPCPCNETPETHKHYLFTC